MDTPKKLEELFKKLYINIVLMLLITSPILVHCHHKEICFKSLYNQTSQWFNSLETLNEIPVTLNCSEDTYVHIENVLYQIPFRRSDFCRIGPTCKQVVCNCCDVKPSVEYLCSISESYDYWNKLCFEKEFSQKCHVNFARVLFDNKSCEPLQYECFTTDKSSNCYGRWVDISYSCLPYKDNPKTLPPVIINTTSMTVNTLKTKTQSTDATVWDKTTDTTTEGVISGKSFQENNSNKALITLVVIIIVMAVLLIVVSVALWNKFKKADVNGRKDLEVGNNIEAVHPFLDQHRIPESDIARAAGSPAPPLLPPRPNERDSVYDQIHDDKIDEDSNQIVNEENYDKSLANDSNMPKDYNDGYTPMEKRNAQQEFDETDSPVESVIIPNKSVNNNHHEYLPILEEPNDKIKSEVKDDKNANQYQKLGPNRESHVYQETF